MKALKKYRWPLTGALLGVLVFLAVYGVRVLDPTSVDWILNSLSPDPIQHYLGVTKLFRKRYRCEVSATGSSLYNGSIDRKKPRTKGVCHIKTCGKYLSIHSCHSRK